MDNENKNEPLVPRAIDQVGKAQAAAAFGISHATLDRWIKHGYVKPVRLPSGRRRFTLSEIERVKNKMMEDPELPSE